MTNTTNAAANTLPCNTAVERAFLAFVREALFLGTSHGVFTGHDRLDYVAAVRAADAEMCRANALGVVVALKILSEREITARAGRSHTAAYINLLHLGRAARVIPTPSAEALVA
jgi:hypothetical protein